MSFELVHSLPCPSHDDMQEVEIVGPATDTAQTVDVPLVICESDAPQLIAHLRTLSPHVTDDGGKTMCVWVPMKLLGRLCQTPVQPGAFYKLSDSKWAKAAPQPVVPTLGVVKHHDSLVLVHRSMRECTTSSHVLRVPPRTSLLGLLWTVGNVNVATCVSGGPLTCIRLRQRISRLATSWKAY